MKSRFSPLASSSPSHALVSSSTSFQSPDTSSTSGTSSGGATPPPPLMALPNSSVSPQPLPPATYSNMTVLPCQRCFGPGHTAPDCPF